MSIGVNTKQQMLSISFFPSSSFSYIYREILYILFTFYIGTTEQRGKKLVQSAEPKLKFDCEGSSPVGVVKSKLQNIIRNRREHLDVEFLFPIFALELFIIKSWPGGGLKVFLFLTESWLLPWHRSPGVIK